MTYCIVFGSWGKAVASCGGNWFDTGQKIVEKKVSTVEHGSNHNLPDRNSNPVVRYAVRIAPALWAISRIESSFLLKPTLP
ncbi:hypothetical protein [Microcoleus sp. LEGE 07076]|uniref:hypothetical protein n=1 Tax=Microcoleus sp. LEGE 07076 TaxID=915322 RepID=UPI001D13A893|nr:hypothetical protein [Microcoleus sp. LEGE 07076]